MEKTIVKSWEDLEKYIIHKDEYRYTLCWNFIDIEIRKTDLESAVKILNALGKKLEYKEIEVIDTLEKWEEFQYILAKKSIYYNRVSKIFFRIEEDKCIEGYGIERIEEKYNINLKILEVKK